MTFIFISRGQYPDQHAAAIRHTTIAQGLVENGHKVYFFLLNPQKWKVNEMNYNGIIFRSLDNHQEENKILKLYNFYTALSKLPFRISEINNSTPVEGIIVFSIGSRIINQGNKNWQKRKY
jgi:hypothetical protein